MEKLQVNDLEHILVNTKRLWTDAKDQTFFITGGTGFFGKWLLSSFIYINQNEQLNSRAIVLTRDSVKFLAEYPQYKNDAVSFINGDITTFDFPEQNIDYIIHAATDASTALNTEQPLLMYDAVVNGTKRVLELAKEKKVKAILHTSSGAVYGEQPGDVTHVKEDFTGAPNVFNGDAAYGEGKRVAEMMAAMYYRNFNVPSKVARCFAFIGPYLALDAHFAIGNFMKNIMHEQDILIKGDGTPYRSYMYAADLIIWLWTILFKAEVNSVYNVGSDEDLSIAELAYLLAGFSKGQQQVKILKPRVAAAPVKRYVPSISKAKTDLGLRIHIDLKESIKRTFAFYNY